MEELRRSWLAPDEGRAGTGLAAWTFIREAMTLGAATMVDYDYAQAQFYEWGPRVLGALAIFVIAWLIARTAKWAIARLVDRVPALRRHYQAEPGVTLGTMLGEVVFWLILLVGIILALQPLQLSSVLAPVQQLTVNAFSYVPNVVGAGLIFAIGFVIARIVKRLVESALMAARVDKWLSRVSPVTAEPAPVEPTATSVPGGQQAWTPTPYTPMKASISRSAGMLVFLLIMIPVTISALDALKIQAISQPATEMLRTILDAIPHVLGALILLAIGFLVGRLVKQTIEQLLPTMGFNRAVAELGVASGNTASRFAGSIAMVAVMIFFAIKSAELLNSPLIATMLAQILELGSRVIVGVAIILAGVGIARLVARLVDTRGRGWLATILNWSIIALAVAMGLRFMGLANEIVIIAFTAIIGSAAVAAALAFGLGGRAEASRLLAKWARELPTPNSPSPPPSVEPERPIGTIPPG
jgi:hypothetical protein